MTFSKEWLQQTIAAMESQRDEAPFGISDDHDMTIEAFKLALAGMEAQPVGEVSEQRDGLILDGTVDLGGTTTHRIIKGASKMKRLPLGTKFYSAPQPLTTSERAELENYRNAQKVVPEAISTRQAMAKLEAHEPCDSINVAYKYGWNSCRAAMLHGGKP